MISAQLPPAAVTNPLPDELTQGRRCTVCDHELAEHDPVSHRYCQATQMHALSRRCICPKGP